MVKKEPVEKIKIKVPILGQSLSYNTVTRLREKQTTRQQLQATNKDSDTVKRYDYLMEFYKTHAGRYAKIKSWYLEQCKDEYADENEASEASSESSEASTANVLTMPR